MEQAAASVRRIREAGRRMTDGPSPEWSVPLKESFFDSLADDFNTPRALAAVFEWITQANRSPEAVGSAGLREMLSVLALENLLDVEQLEVPAEALELAGRREQARAARDFDEADRIREQLHRLGWAVRDGADGPQLLPLE